MYEVRSENHRITTEKMSDFPHIEAPTDVSTTSESTSSGMIEHSVTADIIYKSHAYGLRPKKRKEKETLHGKPKSQLQADYRERLKADPVKWALYRERQKKHLHNWRANLSDEQKEKQRTLNRIRNKDARKRRKADVQSKIRTKKSTPVQRSTRAKSLLEREARSQKREYWKDRQRERRAKWTEEERHAVNAYNRKRYAEKKCTLQPPPVVMLTQSDNLDSTEENESMTRTQQGQYNAVDRVKNVMPSDPETAFIVMKKLIDSASPGQKELLIEHFTGHLKDPLPTDQIIRKQRDFTIKDLSQVTQQINSCKKEYMDRRKEIGDGMWNLVRQAGFEGRVSEENVKNFIEYVCSSNTMPPPDQILTLLGLDPDTDISEIYAALSLDVNNSTTDTASSHNLHTNPKEIHRDDINHLNSMQVSSGCTSTVRGGSENGASVHSDDKQDVSESVQQASCDDAICGCHDNNIDVKQEMSSFKVDNSGCGSIDTDGCHDNNIDVKQEIGCDPYPTTPSV